MGELRRSAIWSDPRVKPPFGSVEIDWGHPLTKELAFCALLNDRSSCPLDLVRRQLATPINGPLPWVTTGEGYIPSFVNNNQAFRFPTGNALQFSSGWSCLIRVTSTVAPAQTAAHHVACIPAGNDANQARVMALNWDHASLGFVRAYSAGNSGGFAAAKFTTVFVANKFYDCGGTYDNANVRCYLSGVFEAISASLPGPTLVGSNMDIGNGGTGQSFNGRVSFMYFWKNPNPAEWFQWLAAEPFVIFKPKISRRFSIPSELRRTRFQFRVPSSMVFP